MGFLEEVGPELGIGAGTRYQEGCLVGYLEEVDPELGIGDGSPSWDREEGIWIEES